MEKQFTWVPAHKALARKLSEYEHRQTELIYILKDAGETILNDLDQDERQIELSEIDPFTFFCYIYKYGQEKQLSQLRKISHSFGIVPLPEDVRGIPSVNAQKVWLFPYQKNRNSNEIARLWSFFKLTMSDKIEDDSFADILQVKSTGKTKITESLFMIDPERFLPINAQTRPYLLDNFKIDPDFNTWSDYMRILSKLKTLTRDPFYKISFDAWVWNNNQVGTRKELDKETDIVGKEHPDFPLHELYLIETISNINLPDAINIFYNKFDLIIQKTGISKELLHVYAGYKSVLAITLGRRYIFMLKRKRNVLYWSIILEAKDLDLAQKHPGFESSGFFNDADGSQNYCWVQFTRPVNEPDPMFGDLLEKNILAIQSYYEEIKDSKLKYLYKRFTNFALRETLFDSDYRSFIMNRIVAYNGYPTQQKLIERYKSLIKARDFAGEEYKWKILGKNHWDLNAPDFRAMVKRIPFKNLVYKLAIGVLNEIADKFPDKLRSYLSDLFNGQVNLQERMKTFQDRINDLYGSVEPNLQSHHDERTISVYLAFYDPELYPIYKNSFYLKYCRLLKRRQALTNAKYGDYFTLVSELISNYVVKDRELLDLYKEKKPKGFKDENFLLLSQDILFRVLDGRLDEPLEEEAGYTQTNQDLAIVKEPKILFEGIDEYEENSGTGDQQFFWLNANPAIWKMSECEEGDIQYYTSHNERRNKRRIYRHFEALRHGDLLIGYESTPVKQIRALFEVEKGLHKHEEEEVIKIKLVEKLEVPVHWSEMVNNPGLKDCEVFINNQGTLFKLTEEEFDIIREVIDNKNMLVDDTGKENTIYSYSEDPEKPFIHPDEFHKMVRVLQRKKNIILQGPPGVGKTFIARKLAYQLMGNRNDQDVEMVQFHQSYSYEDFIQGLRPDKGGFMLKNGVFYNFCQKAHAHPSRQFFFIIDEINRGNLSKIFGEILMLIESDKRKERYALKLTYAEDELDRFFVPDNLYIIGTMNTADRSLAIVDYALRRRFAFITLSPAYDNSFTSFLKSKGLSETLINHILKSVNQINDEINKDINLGSGFLIGHSYFCNYSGNLTEVTWYNDVIDFEIRPLLEEIWFDDIGKVSRLIAEIKL
jgi:5-methylcytosine-specific restriction protein B